MRRGGFTLLEALVAVVILASVGAASLKLVMLSQKTLSAVDERERLLDGAREIEIGLRIGELEERGTSGDLRWETEEKETEMFDEDFGRLNLEGLNFDRAARSADVSETVRARWRELTVRDSAGDSITIFLPAEEDMGGAPAASGSTGEETKEEN